MDGRKIFLRSGVIPILAAVFFLISFLGNTPAVTEEAVDTLKFSPAKGDSWEYQMMCDVTVEQKPLDMTKETAEKIGLPLSMHMVSKVYFLVKVEETNPFVLSLTYEQISPDVTMNGQEVSASFMALAKNIKGKTVYAKIFPSKERVIEVDYSGLGDDVLGFAKSFLAIDRVLSHFPREPVAQNNSWQNIIDRDISASSSLPIIQRSSNAYLFKNREENNGYVCARIDKKADITRSFKGTAQEIFLEGSGSGISTGSIFFDMKDGKVVALEEQNRISLKQNMKKADDVSGTATTEISEKRSFKLLKGRRGA